jgi:tetratricopeptide (TPR) repeat protein
MWMRPGLACGLKGGLPVSEGKNRVMAAGGSVLTLAVCLFLGCSSRQPPTDLYLDAVALRELGQNELAVSKLSAVVAADPGFALAYAELGKAYQALGNREKALTAFEQAAKLAPWSVENSRNLGKIRETLGKYPQAGEAYGRAAELDPKSFEAQRGAAECYLKAGESTKSLVYGQLAEKSGEKPREALSLLARAYEAQKDYGQAIEVYRRLAAVAGDDPNVLLSLGVACMKAGQYDRAKQILISVSQRRPENGAVLRDLGYCLLKLGDIDQAMQMYRQSVDLDANDWEAHRGLGVALVLKARQSGDGRLQAEAVRHWRRSLVLKPDQPKREILEKLIREHSKLQNLMQELDY